MSEKATHSPGPWCEDRSDCGEYHRGIYDSRAVCIALVWRGEDPIPSEERKANARLIAAAPDLLAACRKAVEVLAPFNGEGAWDEALEPIRAALVKADPNAQQETSE